MQSYFTLTALATFILCLIIGLGYAWLLYNKNTVFTNIQKKGLFTFRAVSVFLIAYLIGAPLIKTISYTLEKPIIVIAHDNSTSVKRVSEVGYAQYSSDLSALRDQLSNEYEVKVYSFGDSVKNRLEFSGTDIITNAAKWVRQINDEFQNRNVGAVIWATDGLFNRGGNPQFDILKLNAPVYAIALGDTIAPKDLLIANINYNEFAFVGNDFFIEVQVQAIKANNERVHLIITENDRVVYEQTVAVNSNLFVKDFQIKLSATSTGIKRLKAHIVPIDKEITNTNNSQNFFIDVIDSKQDILIAAAAPHPDLAVIKRALENNKQYKVKLALADELIAVDLSKYGVVVLHQLPSTQYPVKPFIEEIQNKKLPFWSILGASTNLGLFNLSQNSVSLNSNIKSLQQIFPVLNEQFSTFNLQANYKEQVKKLDPLISPFGRLSINGTYSALLNQKIGSLETTQPLWFFTDINSQRNAFLLGEGLWRWKFIEDEEESDEYLTNDLILNTIQYLSVKDDKRSFKVFPSKRSFDELESVIINANLYNDNYNPINTPDIQIVIKNSKGEAYNYNFSRSENAYKLDVGMFKPGIYTYQSSVQYGNKTHTAKGEFYVNEVVAEVQQTVANHSLLKSISDQTGGKVVNPQNMGEIVKDLKSGDQLKTLSFEDRKYEELINFKLVFFIILSLLSVEWFLRKRFGDL